MNYHNVLEDGWRAFALSGNPMDYLRYLEKKQLHRIGASKACKKTYWPL